MSENEVSITVAEIGVYLRQIEINLASIRTSTEIIEKARSEIGELCYNRKLKEVEEEESLIFNYIDELKRRNKDMVGIFKTDRRSFGAKTKMDKEKICWICGRTWKEAETAKERKIAQWKEQKKAGFKIPEGYDYNLPTKLGFVHLRLLKKLKNGGWLYVDKMEEEEVKVPIVASMEICICCVCSALIDARIEERALRERARRHEFVVEPMNDKMTILGKLKKMLGEDTI